MKKLLLLIAPLLMMSWVSADLFTFSPAMSFLMSAPNAYYTFSIWWTTSSNINLYSVYYNNTCANTWTWSIWKYTSSSNWVVIYSWLFDISTTWLLIIDKNLSGASSYILWTSPNCNYNYKSPSNYIYYSWFFSTLKWWNWMAAPNFISLMDNGNLWWWWPDVWTFSWTDPRIATPTPITIWYNWTWMTFAGSNIYLDGLFHNYTMSGSDIVFQPYVYRALFRSH